MGEFKETETDFFLWCPMMGQQVKGSETQEMPCKYLKNDL